MGNNLLRCFHRIAADRTESVIKTAGAVADGRSSTVCSADRSRRVFGRSFNQSQLAKVVTALHPLILSAGAQAKTHSKRKGGPHESSGSDDAAHHRILSVRASQFRM